MTDKKLFPTIKTPRLELVELCPEHAEALHAIWTDPRVIEHLVLEPFTSMDQTLEMIDLLQKLYPSEEGIRWGILERSSNRILGTCGFHRWSKEHRRGEMGYELAATTWRQGFMSEAVKAALQYAFGTMELNRVEALVTVGNKASSGFLTKMGFQLEGTLRDYEWARGKFQDQWMFSLLKKEWDQLQ